MEPYKWKLLLLLLGLALLFAPLWWWSWRKNRQEVLEHEDALAAFANEAGGTVSDASGDVLPWSAGLASPFLGEHDGLMGLVSSAGGPQFDYALEFVRNGWRIRVCEASVEVRTATTSGNTVTHHEHRIEVLTSDLVPLKIVVGGGAGRGLLAKWAAEPTRAVEGRERPLWMELRLPELSGHLTYTSDLPAAGAVVNGQVVAWLQDHARRELIRQLGFEAGIVYTTAHGQIDVETMLHRVDELLDLLGRMPGVRPRHPAAAV
ncbi:hypothetical protein [Lentzea sp. NPDC051838]|uniref:hypothetical protein n=1 Tax=Lentzea sp. NPDC051838 TaxID=3154849 RepID=UPI003414CCCD